MHVFAEIDAGQAFTAQLQRAKSEIESLDETILSRVEDETYTLRILSQVRIDPLRLRFDDAYISTHERMIPAEDHPHHRFFFGAGQSNSRQVIRYHLPFDGDPNLLRCIPNPRMMWSIDVDVSGNEVTFEIVNWGGDIEMVRRICSEHGLQYIMTLIDSDLPMDETGRVVPFPDEEICLRLHDKDDSGKLFKRSILFFKLGESRVTLKRHAGSEARVCGACVIGGGCEHAII